MGRLFDAVSCMLGLCSFNKYEGECAIILENYAYIAIKNRIEPYRLKFDIEENNMDPAPVLSGIIEGIRKGVGIEALALGFHLAVSEAVLNICRNIRQERGINICALSGGVFQNSVLTGLCRERLEAFGFRVCLNRLVPPNDGGIALGQAFVFLRNQ
jgi:hydrogenase maturation protein HypF